MIMNNTSCLLFLIECKTRCNARNEHLARGKLNLVTSKYTMTQWNDPKLSKIVDSKHELIQCLHHAAVYDL